MLTLNGESAGEWKSGELLLTASGEKFGAEAQAMAEGDGLQAVAEHSADAHQTVTVAQQREHFAAGGRGNVNVGKIAMTEQVEQQLGVTPIVFLPATSELADSQSVADAESMAEICDEAMKPQRVARGFHAVHRGSWELRIKRTHVVMLVVERELVLLSVGFIKPTESLCADVQIHSDVHCHLRLLTSRSQTTG